MSLEKTQLKLSVSKRCGELIGFVSKHPKTQKLMGVREDSLYGKKICLLSEDLKGTLLANKLYDVTLKPMHNGKGYVIINALPVEFTAIVEAHIIPKQTYQITISFGNKIVYYDPINGRTDSSKTESGVIELLRSRCDLKAKEQVISEFLHKALLMRNSMSYDGML